MMEEDRELVVHQGSGSELVETDQGFPGMGAAVNVLAQNLQSEQWDDVSLEFDCARGGATRLKFRAYRRARRD
jgi:hypothetical protein